MKQEAELEDMEPEEDFSEDLSDDTNLYPDDLGYDNFYDDIGAIPAERHNDLFKRLTDFDKFIKRRTKIWLGQSWDAKKQEWMQNPNIPPIMNIRGAEWCAGFLDTYARDNNLITRFETRDEFNYIMADVIDVLWLNIPVRAKEFGIRNNGDSIRICNEMEHAIVLILLGAARGGYNDLFTKTTARHESVNLTPMPQYAPMPRRRKGIGDRLKSIFGGG